MIRTIKQRIYVVGLLPLAVLAVALVMFNGVTRIREANQALLNAQQVTAALLQSPAADALVVGNRLSFEETAKKVIKTSPLLVCVTLRDSDRRTVSQVGSCHRVPAPGDYCPINVARGGLSDFNEAPIADATYGDLGIVMNDDSLALKRREIIIQLTLSLSLIVGVLLFIGWLLRARLIEPIHRIGSAMHSLSEQDYNARVPAEGNDELTRLAEATNRTITTIASYTRELERRRSDADRALLDADEANLARIGLVSSLTEDLEGPLAQLHSELTTAAMANQDPALRSHIRESIRLVQAAQEDLADLLEIAAAAHGNRPPPPRDLDDILSDIERELQSLSQSESLSVSFVVSQMPFADARRGEPSGALVEIDAVRFTKALTHLIRAIGRQSKPPGIYINAELLELPGNQLDISVHVKAFYDAATQAHTTAWRDQLSRYGSAPALMGWADRETRIIDYLLRAVGIEPTLSVSPSGAVSVLLHTSCHYTQAAASEAASADLSLAANGISATIVSNDVSLMRLTRRGEMSNVDLKLIPFVQALADTVALGHEAALLIDVSDDVAESVRLLDQLSSDERPRPALIAICPPGRMSDALDERLLELGFNGAIQKPLQYSRLVEAIRATLSRPLKTILRNGPADQADGDR
jgi:HAMP domain-containing protein